MLLSSVSTVFAEEITDIANESNIVETEETLKFTEIFMNRNRAIALYLLGTLGQIWLICIIVFILRKLGIVVDCTTLIGMVAIGIGGVSSALWGTVIAIRYKKHSMKKKLLGLKQKLEALLKQQK